MTVTCIFAVLLPAAKETKTHTPSSSPAGGNYHFPLRRHPRRRRNKTQHNTPSSLDDGYLLFHHSTTRAPPLGGYQCRPAEMDSFRLTEMMNRSGENDGIAINFGENSIIRGIFGEIAGIWQNFGFLP